MKGCSGLPNTPTRTRNFFSLMALPREDSKNACASPWKPRSPDSYSGVGSAKYRLTSEKSQMWVQKSLIEAGNGEASNAKCRASVS
jgi:hypothetical protein